MQLGSAPPKHTSCLKAGMLGPSFCSSAQSTEECSMNDRFWKSFLHAWAHFLSIPKQPMMAKRRISSVNQKSLLKLWFGKFLYWGRVFGWYVHSEMPRNRPPEPAPLTVRPSTSLICQFEQLPFCLGRTFVDRLGADSMVPLLHGVLAYGPWDLIDTSHSSFCIREKKCLSVPLQSMGEAIDQN